MSRETEGIHFQGFEVKHGLLVDTEDASDVEGQKQLQVYGLTNDHHFECQNDGTYFLLVSAGQIFVKYGDYRGAMRAYIPAGGWAVLRQGDVAAAAAHASAAVVIFMRDYRGVRQVGHPIENKGRLKYIDGCSDTLLMSPPVKGEPCLNHLHIPHGIKQTRHTHPSDRVGIIVSGKGRCITPLPDDGTMPTDGSGHVVSDGEGGMQLVHDLKPGMFWRIPRGGEHSFFTDREGERLDVIAFHPDSDFGPEHDYHPMLNRTVVDGKPGYDPSLTEIRTKDL